MVTCEGTHLEKQNSAVHEMLNAPNKLPSPKVVFLAFTCLGLLQLGIISNGHITRREMALNLSDASPNKVSSIHETRAEEQLISVCIPAIPRDVDSGCLDELISSIADQTLSAAEVVISFTNSSYSQALRLRTSSLERLGPVPVRIVRSSDVYVQGKSRNNAALVSTAELISFVDADDKMHPERLEVIQGAFRGNENLTLLLHGFVEDENASGWDSESMLSKMYTTVGKEEICESEIRSRRQPNLDLLVHHAHVTVRRELFEKFRYDESPARHRIEDSVFVREVVAAACSRREVNDLLVLKAPLSMYRRKMRTCHLERNEISSR